MTPLEKLEQQIYDEDVEIITHDFKSKRIRAVYCDSVIGLSPHVKTNRERKCLLAEELAHHLLNSGNVIEDPLQERKARRSAHDKLIGLDGLIRAYESGCVCAEDIADYLEVTSEFLEEAIFEYSLKYGTHAIRGKHIIAFQPCLQIYKSG